MNAETVKAEIAAQAIPEKAAFYPKFFRAFPGSDLLLFNEAETKPESGFGLRVGAGYSALGSTFEFTQFTNPTNSLTVNSSGTCVSSRPETHEASPYFAGSSP